jgi:putative SOS response-associated peptidase YedK
MRPSLENSAEWNKPERSEHDPRMPVILPEQHHAAWLGETEDGNLKDLLVPYPADQMRMWEISPRVNSPKNDDPSLWEPIHPEPTQDDNRCS